VPRFNLIRLPGTDDPAAAERLVEANRAIYHRGPRHSAPSIPASAALPLTPAEWRDHFGPLFELLCEAKERFDPDMLLTPGYEMFTS
jgi:hypothetical protein